MQDDPSDRLVHLVPAKTMSRRKIVALTAKLVGGAALSVVAGTRLAQVAAAQDEEIILTAAASEVGAKPGSAYARGYAAYAAGDQDAGATTQAGIGPPTGVAASAAPSDGGDTAEAGAMLVPPASSNKG
jgi:hypothetical protein